MKTKIEQANKKFQPINITLTLETPEDLKKFLMFTSAMSDANSYADDILYVSIDSVDYSVDECDIAQFVDQMITGMQWKQLEEIYAKFK